MKDELSELSKDSVSQGLGLKNGERIHGTAATLNSDSFPLEVSGVMRGLVREATTRQRVKRTVMPPPPCFTVWTVFSG